MTRRSEFRAPWSRELFVMSAFGLLVLGLPTAINLSRGRLVIGTILLTALMIPLSLTVRGYAILPRELLIRRLFWASRWPLSQNTVAAVRPKIMEKSWRLWGNGGLFSVSGSFSNAALGRYRAFVTDSSRTVVLETPRGLLVVSPDEPVEFVAAVSAATAPRE